MTTPTVTPSVARNAVREAQDDTAALRAFSERSAAVLKTADEIVSSLSEQAGIFNTAGSSRSEEAIARGVAATPQQLDKINDYKALLDMFYSGELSAEVLAEDKALSLYLEQAMQFEQRLFQLLSNIAKMHHETMQGIIGNLRG